MRAAVAAIAAILLLGGAVAAQDAGKPVGLPPAPAYKETLKDAGKPVMAPLAAMPTDFAPPVPPAPGTRVSVCQNGEAPDCLPTIEEALRRHRVDGLHVRVHCGTYPGGSMQVQMSDLRIEGVPCADGTLPHIAMQGWDAENWLEFTGFARGLWVENLHLAGPGGRKNPIRLDAAGPYVIKGMVIENQQNGVFSSARAEGDIWVLDSRFDMNGHGSAGRQHHIYLGCKTASCRGFIVNSRFYGVYSKRGQKCSNQVRSRARETYIVDSLFDSREGCVSRAISTDVTTERLLVRNSIFIQGQTENAMLAMTPMGGAEAGELVVENVVVASLRRGLNGFITNHVAAPIRLRDVIYYHEGTCRVPDACVVFYPDRFPGQVEARNVRVTTDRDDLPAQVRDLL